MKVSELKDAKLDYWVGRAIHSRIKFDVNDPMTWPIRINNDRVERARTMDRMGSVHSWTIFDPSTDGNKGMVLIEKYGITVTRMQLDVAEVLTGNRWNAWIGYWSDWAASERLSGSTPLEAAMRALVASVYGDEVEG